MSKPKIIKAIDDLDYQGFYNKSTYLGDIRTDSTCLDSVLENGIYTFTGGLDEPTDTSHAGDYKWSLLVKSNQDSTSSIQIAERISGPNTNRKLPYYRYYSSGTWTEFKQELQNLKVRSASESNYIEIDGANIIFSTSDGGGLYFLDEGSPGSPVLAFYGNSGDELVRLNHIADPEDDYDAANKKYADTKLSKSGGTMTGDLVLNADPTTDMQAATKKYVDDRAMSKTGDTMTGYLTLVGDPTADKHAATKKYVDDKVKDAVPAFSNGPIVIESSTTFVPSDHGISIGDKVRVVCVGGGGGGGGGYGSSATGPYRGDDAGAAGGGYGAGGYGGSGNYGYGGHGGCGYLVRGEITINSNSIPVTIGVGGSGGHKKGDDAGNGTSTSFGSYLTAGPGTGGRGATTDGDGAKGTGGKTGTGSSISKGWTIKSYSVADSSSTETIGSGVVMIWY